MPRDYNSTGWSVNLTIPSFPLFGGLGVALWHCFIRPQRCLTSAEVDKWGAEGEVLLWWFTLAHEILSAETFILHHATITSVVCKFWNRGIYWYYLSFISLLNIIRKNRSEYSNNLLCTCISLAWERSFHVNTSDSASPSHVTASPPYLLTRTWPLWRENTGSCFRRRVQRANWQSWSGNPPKPAERHWRPDLHLDSSLPHQEGGSHIKYLLCLFFNKLFF